MAHRKDGRDRLAASPTPGPETTPPAEPTPGGPRDFTTDVEHLADGRYILYYAWAAPEAAVPRTPRRAPRARPAGR